MPPLAKEATAAPTTLPRATSTRASSTNCRPMVRFGAPMAFRTPISRRRSRTSMTMIRRMIRPAVPRAATKAMKEMFLTLSSELTAVCKVPLALGDVGLVGAERRLRAVLAASTFSMLLTVTIMVESSSGSAARVWAVGSVT